MVLSSLKRTSNQTLTELSRVSCCSTAAMTDIKDKLQAMGLIDVKESKEDRRRKEVSLTELGYTSLENIIERFVCARPEPSGDGGSSESGK